MVQGDETAGRDTAWLRRFYDRSAGEYDLWMRHYDRWFFGDARAQVCSRAKGPILELAIGTGLNLPFYPADVPLTGIDLSPAMLEVAGRRARELGREVDLRLGDAHDLAFPDECFETVVATLFLSTVPDPWRAASEAWRVLRPGGQLLLLDHVRSSVRPVRWAERLIAPLMASRAGVHLMRDPLDYLKDIGFRVEHCRQSRAGIIEALIGRKVSPAT